MGCSPTCLWKRPYRPAIALGRLEHLKVSPPSKIIFLHPCTEGHVLCNQLLALLMSSSNFLYYFEFFTRGTNIIIFFRRICRNNTVLYMYIMYCIAHKIVESHLSSELRKNCKRKCLKEKLELNIYINVKV